MVRYQSQRDAITKYRDKNYERVVFDVRKGKKDFFKQEAAKRGLSLAALIQDSIAEYLENHPLDND